MPRNSPILYRAGALTPIHIPTEQEEAARDLLRCREDIRADLLRARHRLSKFLLRHGRRFTGTKKAWSKRHDTWLRAQLWPLPALDQTHAAYLRTVDEAVARLRTVEAICASSSRSSPCGRAWSALRCFRGIDDLTALTIAAELGDAATLSDRPARDGLCRPGAVGTFQRHETGPRRDHQNRQRASPARARRSGVALSASALCRRRAAAAPAGGASAPSSRRRGRRSSASIVATIGSAARETQTACHHRRRARTDRLRVGGFDPVI